MATQIQLRRGTTNQHATFTGALSEVTIDTDKVTAVVHDGSTAGGIPLATEFTVNDRIQIANVNILLATKAANTYVNQTFVTKSTALTSNNNLKILIDDRIQVANVNQTFVTKSVALTSNNNLKVLIDDRMQVANVISLISSGISNLVDSAPEALNTLSELAAALGNNENFSTTVLSTLGTKAANTYVNETFVTKSTALTSNNNLKVLIDDRIQVANARVEFLQSSNTSITSNAFTITTEMNEVDLEDRALINPAGFLTLNIGGVNYKLPFFS